MGDYLVVHVPRGRAADTGDRLRAAIEADGRWTLALGLYQMAVYVRGPRPPPVRPLPRQAGVLIGEIHDAGATREGRVADLPLGELPDLAPEDLARWLTARGWGRYVAILKGHDEPPAIYREPMGALECLTWTIGEASLVSSVVEAGRAWSPPDLAIDWAAAGSLLADSVLWSQVCPLKGVMPVAPGTLRFGPGAGQALGLWRPADFARAEHWPAEPEALARVVDGAVAALARDRQAILVEISGGLDSAIVAASLARCGAPVAGAVNFYWPEPEGDERAWAQRIADRCGFALATGRRDLMRVDGDKLARHALAARPGLNAQDPDLDQDLADHALALGADALVSGQGGDAVFYQMAHHALAADILLGKAAPGGRLAALSVLARRARATVWSLLAKSLRPLASAAPVSPPPGFLGEGLARGRPHAWIDETRGVSRAKRIQIRALTNCQNAFGDSLRGRAAELLYPLMSQPVVEHCLSIPAPVLAVGEVDRPFARAAFLDRLPPESLARRAKGDVTVFFSKSLAASLPALRPYLLEGRLAGAGLIDPRALEPLLHPEPMIWRDDVGDIMLAAYVEAWVRAWERRLADS